MSDAGYLIRSDLCSYIDKATSGMVADSQQQIQRLIRGMGRSLEAVIYFQGGHKRY